MPQLPRDDPDVHALGPQLRRVGVPQPVGVNALLDAGAAGKFGQEAADVGRATGPSVKTTAAPPPVSCRAFPSAATLGKNGDQGAAMTDALNAMSEREHDPARAAPATAPAAEPRVVITLVHGTILFARWPWVMRPLGTCGRLWSGLRAQDQAKGEMAVPWHAPGSRFRVRLERLLGPDCRIEAFQWSGSNSMWDRMRFAGWTEAGPTGQDLNGRDVPSSTRWLRTSARCAGSTTAHLRC